MHQRSVAIHRYFELNQYLSRICLLAQPLTLTAEGVQCQVSEFKRVSATRHCSAHHYLLRSSICSAQPCTPAANNRGAELTASAPTWDNWKSGTNKIKQCSDKAALKQDSARGSGMWHKLIRATLGSRRWDLCNGGETTPVSVTSGGGIIEL